MLTHAFDIASGFPWPEFVSDRVRRNRFTDEWAGREAELRARRAELGVDVMPAGPLDPDVHAVRYGQSAAFVDEIRPVADVLRRIVDGASVILRSRLEAL